MLMYNCTLLCMNIYKYRIFNNYKFLYIHVEQGYYVQRSLCYTKMYKTTNLSHMKKNLSLKFYSVRWHTVLSPSVNLPVYQLSLVIHHVTSVNLPVYQLRQLLHCVISVNLPVYQLYQVVNCVISFNLPVYQLCQVVAIRHHLLAWPLHLQ